MIDYREARAVDAQDIGLLHAQNYGANNQQEVTEALSTEFIELWRSRLIQESTNQLILAARNDTGLVGFVCAFGSRDSRWGSLIDNLHVSTPARQSGVASSLLIKTAAWLSLRYGEVPVYLLVLERNVQARKLYEKFGGRCTETLDMETHGGNIVHNCRYTWTQPAQLYAT